MAGRPIIKKVVLFIFAVWLGYPGRAIAQDAFERALAKKVDSLLAPDKKRLLPNDAMQTLTIPSGFGGYGSYLFGFIGGVYPQVYSHKADLIASGGFCVGNPAKAVNLSIGVNVTDVHQFSNFSANVILSRIIFTGTSISAGGLQLFANPDMTDVHGGTYFVAISHAVQTLPSETPGSSKLTYTIGVGNGRFYLKSPDDIAAGRGEHGTAVFGGISYEIMHHVNLIAEWSGVNLGLSVGIRPFKNPLSIGAGIINLTRYSGDKPTGVMTIGYPLSLSR